MKEQINDRNSPGDIFIGIRADASLQENLQAYLAAEVKAPDSEAELELWIYDDKWYAGSRFDSGRSLVQVVEFASKVRTMLTRAIRDERFPESRFMIFFAAPQVPAIIPEPREDQDPGNNEWP